MPPKIFIYYSEGTNDHGGDDVANKLVADNILYMNFTNTFELTGKGKIYMENQLRLLKLQIIIDTI